MQTGPRVKLHLWLLSALLIFHSFLCASLLERQPVGWDALGYQVAGRNITRGDGPAIEHPLNEKLGPYFTLAAFAGQHPRNPSRLYLNYPPGFPVLLAVPQLLGLPDFLMLPVLSLLGVLFTYILGSLLFDHWTGLLGASIVAFTPAFLEWGTSFWADLPGSCLMWGGLAAYLVALRKEGKMRQVAFGGLAGLFILVAIFVKYTNALVLLPTLLYAVCTQRASIFRSVASWAFVAMVVVGLIGVGLYNQSIYGNPFETHYSASRSGFSFPIVSLSYALGPSPIDGYGLIVAGKTLCMNFSWLLLLAILGIARSPRGAIVSLGGLFLVFLGLSSIFAWAPQNEDTRYLLPLFAPVGLFAARGCLSVSSLRVAWKKWLLGIVLTAVGVTLSIALVESWHSLVKRNEASLKTQEAARSLTAGSEQDAVFLAYYWNDPINYFGERTTLFYRRMDLSDPLTFENTLTYVVTSLLADELPVYYVVDRQPSFADSLPILQRHFDLLLWKEAPLAVYQIIPQE